MSERRRKDRTDLDAQLKIRRLDGTQIMEVDISVTNVSTSGIGFMCAESLEMGSVYEGVLTIWTKEKLPVFIEIVRISQLAGKFNYGAIFIGMPEFILNKINTYQIVERETKK